MKELQGHAKRLQQKKDQLWAQMEKSSDLGKDVRDSDSAAHKIARNKGKEPIVHDDVDTLAEDELLITTQIVLFHTLNTTGFEHFLRSNQPN